MDLPEYQLMLFQEMM